MNSFYKELQKAKSGDKTSMFEIINEVMPMINLNAKINNKIDEELKETLIATVIKATKLFDIDRE
ncbi:hypothetical protein AGMMS50284_7350 [Clostridia bacterium]|nr:hypothetical protein AGMMS50284_7350 [Clostridia bacterium]